MNKVGIYTLFIPLIGIVSLIIAGVLFWQQYSLINYGETTYGKVAEYVKAGRSYYPRVVFTTKDNRTISFRGYLIFERPPVDAQVQVFYDPADSQRAVINHPISIWFGTAIAFFLGIIFSVSGWMLVRLEIINPLKKNIMWKRKSF